MLSSVSPLGNIWHTSAASFPFSLMHTPQQFRICGYSGGGSCAGSLDRSRLPFGEDYLDVGSVGAAKARGRDFFSAGFGFRWQALDNVSVGLTYEIPLESRASHLMDHRFTLNTTISF